MNSTSENIFSNVIDFVTQPVSITDSKLNIINFNSGFAKFFPGRKLKGKKLSSILLIEENTINKLRKNQSYTLQAEDEQSYFIITPLYEKRKKTGYTVVHKVNTESGNESFRIRNIWENILELLLKDDIPGNILEDVLKEYLKFPYSLFAVYINTSNNFQDEIKTITKAGRIDLSNLINLINTNLTFIQSAIKKNGVKTIFDFNELGLPALNNYPSNLVLVPCIFHNSVLGILLLGSEKKYTQQSIHKIEQLADLISFILSYSKLYRANKDLENKFLQSQKLETISKLSSGIAHDLNNLLSGIFGSINLLKRKLPEETGLTYLVENLESCSIRAAELTKGLLNFGKPTPKRRTLIKSNNLIRELLVIIEQSFSDKIKIHKDIQLNLNDISGNPTEIYRVLFNLLINAKEAICDEGIIEFSASNFTLNESNAQEYPLLKTGSYVKFSVKDNGIGIIQENLSKIFEPYFSTKQKEVGSGLGLYVTYGIIKAHNGYIDVKSRINHGTEFSVFLPSYDNRLIAGITEKIILLADDEVLLRDLLAELLESYNYQVICVQNGKEALRVLTEEIKVDLLIIDYKMPEMDGITCIKKIREFKVDIPIILSTGSSSDEIDLEIEKLKVASLLKKPYEFEQMLYSVQSLI